MKVLESGQTSRPMKVPPKTHTEQSVAHGAAGRVVSAINVVRRGPVNGDVALAEAGSKTKSIEAFRSAIE